MADSPRLEELRRRVQADPASIAFAALAEEYRRAGKFREAVEASRAGLRYHPTYVSARVTLGRSLVELEEVEQAERELVFVLKSAPDNLAARRALGELYWQQLRFGDALVHFRTAHALAPADTELPTILQSLERELAADRNGAYGTAEEEATSESETPAAAAPAPAPAPILAEPVAAAPIAAAEEETVILAAPPHVAAPLVDATPHVAATPIVEAMPVVEATPVVEEMPVIEAMPVVEATPLVFEATSLVETLPFGVESAAEVTDVDAVEYVAEFEAIEAVTFVDDHATDATQVVIEELPAVADVIDQPLPVAAPAAATRMNGHAQAGTPAPTPNPALVRLERFHRAILAARQRSRSLHS